MGETGAGTKEDWAERIAAVAFQRRSEVKLECLKAGLDYEKTVGPVRDIVRGAMEKHMVGAMEALLVIRTDFPEIVKTTKWLWFICAAVDVALEDAK